MANSNEQEELNTSSESTDLSSSDATSTDVPSEVTLLSDGSLTTLSALDNLQSDNRPANVPNEAYFKTLTASELNWELKKQTQQKCSNHIYSAKDLDTSSKTETDLTDEDEENVFVYEEEQTTTDECECPEGETPDPYETTESSEIVKQCEISECPTRELLKHYLENSESVDDLKIYKLEPSKYFHQFGKQLINLLNFTILVVTSKPFWNTCLIIMNVLASVFFYLVLAVSTILVNLILNIHDAMLPESKAKEKSSSVSPRKKGNIVNFPVIDDLIKMKK